MNQQERRTLEKLIQKARVVSFDVFDTLLFRKVNEPEIVFDLVGKRYGIHGFRKLRTDAQNEASRKVCAENGWPHVDMERIYAELVKNTEYPVNWSDVKDFEIQLERDCLTPNPEMLEIFRFAKGAGKRVIAVSDMYLSASFLREALKEGGYDGFDYIYCSADEHRAKFNRELFDYVKRREGVAFHDILHIGDNPSADVEIPGSFAIKTFLYHPAADTEKVKGVPVSDVDNALYKILCDGKKSFWYNLGVEAGGPIYLALLPWMERQIREWNGSVWFLSRDGYNLCHLLRERGYSGMNCLYASRRALVLAGITEMDEKALEVLPPYARGMTVGEILDYLRVPREEIRGLSKAGFSDFDDIVRTDEEIAAFQKLYRYDEAVFLRRCAEERENARTYLESVGFPDGDSLVFDCGWSGSSQYLLERLKRALGWKIRTEFRYLGIRNMDKSRHQLHGLHYDTFLFDFYKNYSLAVGVNEAPVLYELFFSAPHESVWHYDSDGKPAFEAKSGASKEAERRNREILEGISDYLRAGLDFVREYGAELTPETCIGHLNRLIQKPTEEEARIIGDIIDWRGRIRTDKGESVRLASPEDPEALWPRALLKRDDVSDTMKKEVSEKSGIPWPEPEPEKYHSELDQAALNYRHFWEMRNRVSQKESPSLKYNPTFSVVVPVYNTVTEQLTECVDSVLNQTYSRFELILVEDCSTWPNVAPTLRRYEGRERVRIIWRETNGNISAATNDGVAAAKGDYIAFMDCDDVITPDALYEMAKLLNERPELDFIYSDEDKITEDGAILRTPFLKPDWSPDLFLCMNYTNHLSVYRASIAKSLPLRSAYNGSQDYDFVLRFMEKSHNSRVGHVPKVLYHWRERKESVAYAMSAKNYAIQAAWLAKEDYIRRNNMRAYVENIPGATQSRIVYIPTGFPLVSIIIPSKDNEKILRQCVDSIREFTRYQNYEIIVVDNGSEPETRKKIADYLESADARYFYKKEEFNFSKMCNRGAKNASGSYLLFLNDDVEIFQPDWLERMLGQAQRHHVGAVSAKLFYPLTTKLQHDGIENLKMGPCQLFNNADDEPLFAYGRNRMDLNFLAITGACLLVSAYKFHKVGGFDESLPVAYNDVALCFALHEAGYYNVLRNDVAAYNYESFSRGFDYESDEKSLRQSRDWHRLYENFPMLKGKDPFWTRNLMVYGEVEFHKPCDNPVEANLASLCGEANSSGHIHIDRSTISPDNSIVAGWFIQPDEDEEEERERKLLIQTPWRKCYAAPVATVLRNDIMALFGGGQRYRFAGFSCVMETEKLRLETTPLRFGMMTVYQDGHRRVCWDENFSFPSLRRNSRAWMSDYTRINALDASPESQAQGTHWSLDELRKEENYYCLQGFAYVEGEFHGDYATSLVFRADGDALIFETQREQRLDVALAFTEEHFLYGTGFRAYILRELLKAGKEYGVFIRLENVWDETDVREIDTGRRVKR